MVPTPPPGSSTSVPGRSGSAYRDWLDERGEAFRHRVEIATLDPFQGCKNAIDDQLEDATCVLDAFNIVKVAGAEVDDVRRRAEPGSRRYPWLVSQAYRTRARSAGVPARTGRDAGASYAGLDSTNRFAMERGEGCIEPRC